MPNKREGQNKRGGSEIFVKFNKHGGQVIGISKCPLISVMNEKRDINVYY